MHAPTKSPALSPIKIFQLNDCDWYAAETLDEAKRAYAEMCGYKSVEDAEAEDRFDEPFEVCSDGLDLGFERVP